MRFKEYLTQSSFPQWIDCYCDYQTLKKIINIVRKAYLVKRKIQDKNQVQLIPLIHKSSNLDINTTTKQLVEDKNGKINQIVRDANIWFFKYFKINKQIEKLFSQMKIHQISNKYQRYQNWVHIKIERQQIVFELLANIYSQVNAVQSLCNLNLEAYAKIHQKHYLTFQKFQLKTPTNQTSSINKSLQLLRQLKQKLQIIYRNNQQAQSQNLLLNLIRQKQPSSKLVTLSSYLFGLINGINIALLILIVTLSTAIKITTNIEQYHRDFPVWRAISYSILFMWILAINLFIFEKLRINYQLILGFKKIKPSATFFITSVSGLTFIFLILYTIYLLKIQEEVDFTSLETASYLPLIIWGIVILYLIIPLPIFSAEGRLLFWKQIFYTLISPIYGGSFLTIEIVEQLISFLIPVADTIYALCFYTKLNLKNPKSQNECYHLLMNTQYIGFIIFTYRIILALRMAYKIHKFKGTIYFFVVVKSSLFILLMLVSLLTQFQPKLIIVWYVIVGPIFIFSYYVDLKYDWKLLTTSHNYLLRDEIQFRRVFYYIVMVFNFLFRFALMLTLSSHVVYSWDINHMYFVYWIAIIEIIRRFFWNLINIEKRHIENKSKFMIRVGDDQKQQLLKQVNKYPPRLSLVSDESRRELLRRTQEINNIKSIIINKKQMQTNILEWIDQQNQQLNIIEDEIILER